jgi:DNA polymerase-1
VTELVPAPLQVNEPVQPARELEQSPLANVQLHLVDTIDKAFAFKQWLGERREVLGVDTETAGLRPHADRLRLVQFGDLNTGWAVPWDDWAGVAKEALSMYEGQLVMHNSPFDSRFLHLNADWEVPWHRIDDTMTQAHIEDPTRPKALKNLASRHVDPKAAAGQSLLNDTMKANGWTWDTVPWKHPHYWVYGALDPVLTAHVHHKLRPRITAIGAEAAYDLEMACMRVCTNMMLRGAHVDVAYCRDKATQLRSWAQECRTWLSAYYGIDNATSNAQVLACLQREGVVFTKMTASGKSFALDKEVLESIDHEVAEQVLKIRRAEKIAGTYLENFVNLSIDGVIRCNINTMGARTGRMSITDPALQTLQRDDPTVRRGIIPSPGNVILSCDADQIEMRLSAHFSQDQGLIDAFGVDEDFFCEVASRLFEERIYKGDKRRQITKNTAYGRLYGAGTTTIARTAKVTPQVAEAFIQRFDHQFPGLGRLMDQLMTEGRQHYLDEGTSYIVTPLGRRLPVAGQREYALLNYKIQGHAAEVLKKGLVDCDAAGLGPYMLFPVHDEIVADVPTNDALEVRHLIEGTLNDHDTYRVPITWSAEIFKDRWSIKG